MKKIILILALFCSFSVNAEDINPKSIDYAKQTTCLDGIRYFVGASFHGSMGFTYKFISSVKIDPKTMQPEKC